MTSLDITRIEVSGSEIALSSPLPVVGGVLPGLTQAKIDSAAGGDIAVVAAIAAKAVKVYRLLLLVSGATVITVKNGATALTGAMSLGAGGSIVLDFSGNPWFTTAAGNAFNINSSAAVQVSGVADYIQA